MTGCSAGYCTNSSTKGFQMCRLPRDEKRRKIWIENMNRPDWTSTTSSSLCEVHFADEMWEPTREGKRRLKSNAVPTIFPKRSGTRDIQFNNVNLENMPTCVVEGCRNSSLKKFKMNSLPRNPVQRALWLKNIGRPNWAPKRDAAVCEVHFAPEMWEKTRVDGTRKLKCIAVPTLFDNRIVKESPTVFTKIALERNESDANVLIPNKHTVIQILPPTNRLNGASNNLKSILKPQIKMKSLKPLILANTGTLTNKKVMNEDQKKIIISKNSDTLEAKSIGLSDSLPNNISVPEDTEVGTNSSQPALNPTTVNQVINLSGNLPITSVCSADVYKANGNPSLLTPIMVDITSNSNCLNTQAKHLTGSLSTINTIVSSSTEQTSISESKESETQQKSEEFVPSGIILNKAEAKKIEDERFKKMDKLLLKQLKLNNALRKKLVLLRRRNERLLKDQDEKQDFESASFLKKVFTDDQIRFLQLKNSNPKTITIWSDETMMKAIKLKKACGLRGYEEILNQNLPYPCIKTIRRWCTARHIEMP